MNLQQINRIESIINGTCIEESENSEKILNSFQSSYGIFFIEQNKRNRNAEDKPIANYTVCLEDIKDWHDFNDIRDVIIYIEEFVKNKK